MEEKITVTREELIEAIEWIKIAELFLYDTAIDKAKMRKSIGTALKSMKILFYTLEKAKGENDRRRS